ncbi:hypothetical protein [Enterobacter hormaechei]|uniref:hypothetical protein n=1 Tax=Enterobacter hormaechei TaxID=158836 RepID=UPI0027D22C49|nr:hypothetical protein [Enterobacter hormaechei]
MSTITKEWLQSQISAIKAVGITESNTLQAFEIALASLEAEPVGEVVLGEYDDCGCHPDAKVVCIAADGQADWENFKDGTRLYTAPPAPVALPSGYSDFEEIWSSSTHPLTQDDEMKDFAWDIWNACRAAMLQGADRPQNEPQNIPENIPATQFKPVADLYGLTSPTGGETSFTFDAVEARDFIDGGWSCQEYVELGRYQEALTDHSEDKLAMVDHSGDSNNMVEPVTTTYKLPFEQWLSKQTGTIDVEYGCVMTEVFFHWLRVAYDAGNSPVIADGWVLVPEEPTHEMLEAGDEQFGTYDVYRRMIAASPQQEVMPRTENSGCCIF